MCHLDRTWRKSIATVVFLFFEKIFIYTCLELHSTSLSLHVSLEHPSEIPSHHLLPSVFLNEPWETIWVSYSRPLIRVWCPFPYLWRGDCWCLWVSLHLQGASFWPPLVHLVISIRDWSTTSTAQQQIHVFEHWVKKKINTSCREHVQHYTLNPLCPPSVIRSAINLLRGWRGSQMWDD